MLMDIFELPDILVVGNEQSDGDANRENVACKADPETLAALLIFNCLLFGNREHVDVEHEAFAG